MPPRQISMTKSREWATANLQEGDAVVIETTTNVWDIYDIVAPLTTHTTGVTKRFQDVPANDHVNFSLERGEIHVLLGENGAGKSTLMNILYGFYQPYEREICSQERV